jgi:CheY-like chemotaxis protein
VQAKAFEPFFTTKEPGRGSGLGLSQVLGFAQQSGGGVRLATAPGAGTTVSVYLPRAAALPAEEGAAAPAKPRAAPAGTPGTVLLVDDDEPVREVTAALLAGLGYRVVEAGSGGAGLEALDRHGEIALLLVDYAMPGMNGAEVAREARARRPDLPVVFVTGYADLAGLAEVPEQRILLKPFRDEELREKLEAALGKRPAA